MADEFDERGSNRSATALGGSYRLKERCRARWRLRFTVSTYMKEAGLLQEHVQLPDSVVSHPGSKVVYAQGALRATESGLLSLRQKVESPGLTKRRTSAFDWPRHRSA